MTMLKAIAMRKASKKLAPIPPMPAALPADAPKNAPTPPTARTGSITTIHAPMLIPPSATKLPVWVLNPSNRWLISSVPLRASDRQPSINPPVKTGISRKVAIAPRMGMNDRTIMITKRTMTITIQFPGFFLNISKPLRIHAQPWPASTVPAPPAEPEPTVLLLPEDRKGLGSLMADLQTVLAPSGRSILVQSPSHDNWMAPRFGKAPAGL